MNLRLLSILVEKPDFPIKGDDRKILEFFVEYLDHNSLWLLGLKHADDPVFTFTNEAQRYTFSMSEIRTLYHDMKSGIPMDWEHIPFEYISKN
jgi:hypothetical protein